MGGANDSALMEFNPKQHVPLEEYTSNLHAMCTHIWDLKQDVPLELVAPPLPDQEAWAKTLQGWGIEHLDHTREVSAKYNQAVCELAKRLNIPCVDLGKLGSECFSDGLHFNAVGNGNVAALVKE